MFHVSLLGSEFSSEPDLYLLPKVDLHETAVMAQVAKPLLPT